MIVLYEKTDVTLAGFSKYENMLFLRTSICFQAHLTGSGDLIEFQSAPCNRLPVCLENTEHEIEQGANANNPNC